MAAVQGAAIGAGLGLAVAADLRIATAEARFSANFVKLGFHPGFGLTCTLPRVVGPQRAAQMLMTGNRYKPEEIADWGWSTAWPMPAACAKPRFGHLDAVDGAFQRDVLQPRDTVVERGEPGGGEFLRAGLAAQIIGVLARHVHHLGGMLDRSGVGQRVDEGALALGGPAVMAEDGTEIRQLWFVAGLAGVWFCITEN